MRLPASISRPLAGPLRGRLRGGDLLTVFAALDALLDGQLLAALGQPAAGLGVAVVAACLWAVYQAAPGAGQRRLALAGLLIVLFLLPQALLLALRGATPPVNDGVPLTEA